VSDDDRLEDHGQDHGEGHQQHDPVDGREHRYDDQARHHTATRTGSPQTHLQSQRRPAAQLFGEKSPSSAKSVSLSQGARDRPPYSVASMS
jgi:hypothetical protein